METTPVVIKSDEGNFPVVRVLGRDHSVAFQQRVYDLLIEGSFDIKITDETTCSVSKLSGEPPINLHPRRTGYKTHSHIINYVHRHANRRRAEYSFRINPYWVDLSPKEPQRTI